MRINKTKAKLRSGQPVFGARLHFFSPPIVEILGALGFDFVVIDCEHQPRDEDDVEHMVRAAESFDITPLVNVPNDPALILRYLDCGAQGLVIPNVRSKAEAEQVVASAKYYPEGRRTYFAMGRSARYSIGIDEREYVEASNRELLILAMVEDAGAIPQLDGIASVSGIDGIYIGPNDLRQSLGFPDRKKLDQTIESMVKTIIASGKVATIGVIFGADMDAVRYYHSIGVRLFTVLAQSLIQLTGAEFLHKARAITRGSS